MRSGFATLMVRRDGMKAEINSRLQHTFEIEPFDTESTLQCGSETSLLAFAALNGKSRGRGYREDEAAFGT